MAEPKLSRVQAIVVPILRADPTLEGVTVNTWVPDVDYRTFPLLNVRRIGGARNKNLPMKHSLPVIELTCYAKVSYGDTENLYETALEALYRAVYKRTMTDSGYLSSIKETMGSTEFQSPFADSWRIQGLIALGIRPLRKRRRSA